MAIPMNTSAGPDNPSPVIHHVVQGHDIDIGSSGVTFATDYVGLAFHGDCHTHMDALCHIAYKGRVRHGWRSPAGDDLQGRHRARRDDLPRRARRPGRAAGRADGSAASGGWNLAKP